MLKYKIAFTINAETLFALAGKILPIQDLKVQELLDPEGEAIQEKLNQLLKPVQVRKASEAKLRKPYKNHGPVSFSPDKGINKIILDALAQRPYRAAELKQPLRDANYSPSSVSPRLQKLRDKGAVIQRGDGFWSLALRSEASDKTV